MMVKIPMLAAFGLLLVSVMADGPGAAQAQAPIGHRQPTATDVPADDSVRGDRGLAGQALQTPKTKKRTRSRRVQSNIDVIMKTPNICSNCNQ